MGGVGQNRGFLTGLRYDLLRRRWDEGGLLNKRKMCLFGTKKGCDIATFRRESSEKLPAAKFKYFLMQLEAVFRGSTQMSSTQENGTIGATYYKLDDGFLEQMKLEIPEHLHRLSFRKSLTDSSGHSEYFRAEKLAKSNSQ